MLNSCDRRRSSLDTETHTDTGTDLGVKFKSIKNLPRRESKSGNGTRTFTAILLILIFVQQTNSQNPEIHQAAGITRFTGIYSFLGSFIAIREAFFLASLVCVLVAGNVFLTFMQLPSYYLPIYHNQRSLGGLSLLSIDHFLESMATTLDALLQIIEFIEGFKHRK